MAEEASELAQAALKLRRALDGTNPTPKSVAECQKAFEEEYADVVNCIIALDLDDGWQVQRRGHDPGRVCRLHYRKVRTGRKRVERKVELMAVFSVEAISEITSINPKSCRIKRATFTCYFCNTAISVCDARVATAMADNGETPICPICGKKTICSLYEFQSHENPNIIEDVRWR